MATNSSSSSSEQLEDEDVSLSDLPHISIEPDQSHSISTQLDIGNVIDAEEEFDFGSSMRGSTFLADTKMCAADELFFKGQILPLRLSVSSDNGLTKLNPTQRLSVSGSESMDRHGPCDMSSLKSISGYRSSSCSSTRISPNSSRSNSNSSSSTATTNTSIANSKPRLVRNQFYTHPSPKPQVQISNGARVDNTGSRRSKKSSSIWDFFRLGLVRTPEQDLSKVLRSNSARVTGTRISVSRNSSINSNNSITFSNNNITSECEKNNVTNTTAALSSEKKSRQSFFNGCKCSFDAVASNAVVPKSNVDKESEARHEKKADKVADDLKMKMKMKKRNNNGSKRKQLKQDMSHQRTYEWLKGL